MSNSLLFHGFNLIGYDHVNTKYENGKFFSIFHMIKTDLSVLIVVQGILFRQVRSKGNFDQYRLEKKHIF